MAKKYLDDTGLSHFWSKLKDYFQVKLVSGTNIKTINNESLLGSGNIAISGGGGGDEYYDFETSITPSINAHGISGALYRVVPTDLSVITLQNALKISAYLQNTASSSVYACPLIITYTYANTGVGFTITVKSITSSTQATGSTTTGKLHIVAPFEISSVSVTM